MIIGIHGKKRSGKDTCADYLVEKYGFEKISFADPVRDALYALNPIVDCYQGARRYRDVIDKFGYEQAKDFFPDIRRLLVDMGTAVGRELIDEDLWVNMLARKLELKKNYVASDVRFINEACYIRDWGGPIIRVIRASTDVPAKHISEEPLPGHLVDHMLYNDSSLSDLYGTLDHIIAQHI